MKINEEKSLSLIASNKSIIFDAGQAFVAKFFDNLLIKLSVLAICIVNISDAAQEASLLSSEMASTSGNSSSLATELQNLMTQFKV